MLRESHAIDPEASCTTPGKLHTSPAGMSCKARKVITVVLLRSVPSKSSNLCCYQHTQSGSGGTKQQCIAATIKLLYSLL